MSIKIFIDRFDTEKILREKSELLRLLPKYRVEKAQKFKNDNAMCESIAAGRLLVKAVAEFLESGFIRSESKYKKPDKLEYENIERLAITILESENHSEDDRIINFSGIDNISNKILYYNISHSGQYAVVAVSDNRIGIDVEYKDDKDFKITKRMFCEEEISYIGDSQDRFRQIWTIKEAFLKCTGKGIAVPLNSFTAQFNETDKIIDYNFIDNENDSMTPVTSGEIVSKGYELSGHRYHFDTFHNKKGYVLTVCYRREIEL